MLQPAMVRKAKKNNKDYGKIYRDLLEELKQDAHVPHAPYCQRCEDFLEAQGTLLRIFSVAFELCDCRVC